MSEIHSKICYDLKAIILPSDLPTYDCDFFYLNDAGEVNGSKSNEWDTSGDCIKFDKSIDICY